MKPRVELLTGPVRSGKTTFLRQWASTHGAAGFLTPDKEELRYILNLADDRWYPFQTNDETTAETMRIGRFHFLKEGFERCALILAQAAISKQHTILVDEVGPLELQGLGHDAAIRTLLAHAFDYPVRIVLVVRQHLVEAVIQHYALTDVLVAEVTTFTA